MKWYIKQNVHTNSSLVWINCQSGTPSHANRSRLLGTESRMFQEMEKCNGAFAQTANSRWIITDNPILAKFYCGQETGALADDSFTNEEERIWDLGVESAKVWCEFYGIDRVYCLFDAAFEPSSIWWLGFQQWLRSKYPEESMKWETGI